MGHTDSSDFSFILYISGRVKENAFPIPIDNFATNLFAGLIAYNLLPKKPAMNLEIIDRSRLIA